MLKKIIIPATTISIFIISGCSTSNPFGVGYEKSVCESSAGIGICGSPKNIYRYRDKIKKVQQDYLKSGLKKELFFGVTNDGRILVKDKRGGRWRDYESSPYYQEIQRRVYRNSINSYYNFQTRSMYNTQPRDYTPVYPGKGKSGMKASSAPVMVPAIDPRTGLPPIPGQMDVPVGEDNELSLAYKKQGSIVQTKTQVGKMIRNNGVVQKIWVAPVQTKKGDLISAHEVYAVVKEPSWTIGEETPKSVKYHKADKPTPFSKNVLKARKRAYAQDDKIIANYLNK